MSPSSDEVNEAVTLLGRLERINLNHWPRVPKKQVILSLHLKEKTDPLSGTSCFVVLRIPDDGLSPESQ
jgi:hypothetical protein